MKLKDVKETFLSSFDKKQQDVLASCIVNGIPIDALANSNLDSVTMLAIMMGMKHGFDMEKYLTGEYNADQIYEVVAGYLEDIDAYVYDDPAFSDKQMNAIRRGMRMGFCVDFMLKPEIDFRKMNYLVEGMEHGYDMEFYSDPAISANTLAMVITSMDMGVPEDWFKAYSPAYLEENIMALSEEALNVLDNLEIEVKVQQVRK